MYVNIYMLRRCQVSLFVIRPFCIPLPSLALSHGTSDPGGAGMCDG